MNETTDGFAVGPAPGSNPRGALVIFLGGSLSKPTDTIASPSTNFLTVASGLGYHAIDLAYDDHQIVGQSCETTAASCCKDASCTTLVACAPNRCYPATRYSIVSGACQPDAAANVCNNLTPDAAILARTALMLDMLAQLQPHAGWRAFIDSNTALPPAQRLVWSKLTFAGHSQGGGHAAFIGSLFPLARVIQLSSTCDAVGSTPAAWTTWTGSSTTNYLGQPWATSPALSYFGLGAPTTFSSSGTPTGGDTSCPYHVAIWQNLGMDAAHENDAADTSCLSAGANTHGASIRCASNAANWSAMLQ